jgi:hypothetical protein
VSEKETRPHFRRARGSIFAGHADQESFAQRVRNSR